MPRGDDEESLLDSSLSVYHERQSKKRTRYVFYGISLIVFAIIVALIVVLAKQKVSTTTTTPLLKASRVLPYAVAGFISPASCLMASVSNLTKYKLDVWDDMAQLGLRPKFSTHSFGRYGYLSGTDQERTSDVMDMFRDPEVKFIIANRGGWGCNRIIDMLDYDVIKANPKPIMGYSDLTGLLNAIHYRTGLVTFHGPMGVDSWAEPDNADYISEVIQNANASLIMRNNEQYANYTTIVPGKARGKLMGGNLSVLVAMLGSKFLPVSAFDGAILFIEEVDEAPYSIDRMLTQLHLAGAFERVNGVVVGRFMGCDGQPWSWQDVVTQRLAPLKKPAYLNAMFGHHLSAQFTLPIGVQAEIDANEGTIQLLESAVL